MFTQDDLQARWWKLEEKLMERFGKKPDMETVLFLIGIQEFGDIRTKFTKEETLRLHGELKNLGFEKNTTYIQTKLDHLKPDQRCTHKENIDDIFQGIA